MAKRPRQLSLAPSHSLRRTMRSRSLTKAQKKTVKYDTRRSSPSDGSSDSRDSPAPPNIKRRGKKRPLRRGSVYSSSKSRDSLAPPKIKRRGKKRPLRRGSVYSSSTSIEVPLSPIQISPPQKRKRRQRKNPLGTTSSLHSPEKSVVFTLPSKRQLNETQKPNIINPAHSSTPKPPNQQPFVYPGPSFTYSGPLNRQPLVFPGPSFPERLTFSSPLNQQPLAYLCPAKRQSLALPYPPKFQRLPLPHLLHLPPPQLPPVLAPLSHMFFLPQPSYPFFPPLFPSQLSSKRKPQGISSVFAKSSSKDKVNPTVRSLNPDLDLQK